MIYLKFNFFLIIFNHNAMYVCADFVHKILVIFIELLKSNLSKKIKSSFSYSHMTKLLYHNKKYEALKLMII